MCTNPLVYTVIEINQRNISTKMPEWIGRKNRNKGE